MSSASQGRSVRLSYSSRMASASRAAVGQHRMPPALHLAAVEIVFASQMSNAEPVDHSLAEPRLFPQLAAGTDRDHAAEILRQREADAARHPAAAGEPGQIGAIRV